VNEMESWLTIATVVKDDPSGFRSTAQSIATQDLSGIEFVVIDSSRDAGVIPDCLESPALERLTDRVIYSWEPPSSIYGAMNSALSRASGQFVLFLNAGDYLVDADILASAKSSLLLTDALWGYGAAEIQDEFGRVVRTPKWDFKAERGHSFARGHFPCHQATFANTELLQSMGGFDTRFKIAADYATFLRLAKFSDPVVMDLVISRFMEGGASTRQWQRSVAEFHRARRSILKLQGQASAREYVHTAVHFAKLGLYRSIVQRWRV